MGKWGNEMPSSDSSKLGEQEMIEMEAVRRILVKSKLSGGVASTFIELGERTNFPILLVARKFSTRQLEYLHVEMRRRPTKIKLMMEYSEVLEEHADQSREVVGLVFPWRGYGGLNILTSHYTMPFGWGSSGSFWRIEGVYYLIEHIDSFIERIGPPNEW